MAGYVHVYFSDEIYQKLKPLIKQRKISKFFSQLVEKEFEKREKDQERERLIASHKRLSENRGMNIWDEAVDDYINKK